MRNRAICANVEVTKSAIYITSQDRKPAVTATAATVRGAVCFLVLLLFGFSSAFAQQHSGNLYWAPPNYTVGGVSKSTAFLNFIFWLTLFVFIAGRAVLVIYLVKYRRREGQTAALFPRQQLPPSRLDDHSRPHLSGPRHLQQPGVGRTP
jgi:hypothetical protein